MGEVTPCGALFKVMKRSFGLTNRDFAGLILSGRPLSDGKSPVSRVNDRTWLSRFVVHAPHAALQDRYFCDFGVSALRVVARLKTNGGKAFTSEQILRILRTEACDAMEQALAEYHQDTVMFRNMLNRIACGEGFTASERAETAMTYFLAVGCMGNVKRAVAYANDYARSVHGAVPPTPLPDDLRDNAGATVRPCAEGECMLGLLRVVDGYVQGAPHWILPDGNGVEIGALVTGEGDVSDVAPSASARHARVWYDCKSATWLVEDLGSRGGTQVASGATGDIALAGRGGEGAAPLLPGDELILAEDTRFVVLAGSSGASA